MRSPKPTLGRLFSALVLPLCLGVLSMSLASSASRADAPSDSLSEVLHSAAEEILKVVKDQAVSVGQITPTGLPDANGGPAIVELLKQELERLRPGSVRRAGAFEIKGDFNLAPDSDPSEAGLGQKVVRLLFRIVDTATGEENNLRLTRFLRDNTTIARVLGVSGPLPLDPAKDQRDQRRERNKAIQENLQNPKAFIDQKNPSRISSTSDSPYQVEILAGPLGDGKARPTEPREPGSRRVWGSLTLSGAKRTRSAFTTDPARRSPSASSSIAWTCSISATTATPRTPRGRSSLI